MQLIDAREAIRFEPNNATAHFNLGLVLSQQRNVSEALQEFLTVIMLEPTHTGAHLQLGKEYMRMGKYEKAIHYLEKSLELNPKSSSASVILQRAHCEYGIELYNSDDFSESASHLLQAVKMNPADAESHHR